MATKPSGTSRNGYRDNLLTFPGFNISRHLHKHRTLILFSRRGYS